MSSPDSIPLKVQDTGLDYGLSVTVNNDLDDYYIISSTRLAGVKVIAFNPEDYPDVTSGGVVELYCSMGYEGLFNIQPYTIYTTDAVKSYPVNKRKCYFEDEIETIYGKYSYSNCLVQCRLRSMMSLCGCAPIYILAPIEYPVCSFQDLNCLDKYKVKWNTVYPINVDAPELAHEREESLVCENCYYGCTDTVYKIGTNFSPLDGTNETIVRIFFANNYAYLYKQDAKFYWFEVLSVLGGLISIMIGCSFVTLAESLMFFCGRIYHAIITNLPRTRQHNH